MIEVTPAGSGYAEVTFRLPATMPARSVHVVGEFNGWDRTKTPLRPAGGDDNDLVAVVELPLGRRYRFRYLLDGERWENDWQADDYAPNEYGGDDSVVDLTPSGRLAAPP